MSTVNYQIKLDQFEGPFDLLLFFIERDELDIYNIPITKIINDFLDFIHQQERLNIELSSEFILFVSTLMRIKARLLLPRKEVDAAGNEIDPRQELIDKIIEYKRFKEAAVQMAEMEAMRMLMVKRGNLQREIAGIGEEASEGTEIQNITLFKLMKAFEKVMQRVHDRQNKPVHTVVRYNYTMEGSRDYMLVKRAGPLFASMVTYGIPFVAIGWGIWGGEHVNMQQVVCLSVILIGVYLANRK